jgi:hypothetical protein
MARYSIERSLKAPKGRLKEAFGDRAPKMRIVAAKMDRNAKVDGSVFVTEAAKQKKKAAQPKDQLTIKVSFPAVLEHSIKDMISSIVEGLTLNGFEPTGIDMRTGFGLILAELGVEDWQTVLEAMLPMDQYEDIIDRTEVLAVDRENALNPPAPAPTQAGAPGSEGPAGAAPHPPGPRKPHPKRTGASEAMLQRAVIALEKASEKLRSRAA